MGEDKALTVTNQEVVLSPAEVVDIATKQAKLLMNIVEQTKCFQEISGKKYLMVEAWETIGAFNRTHAETDWTEPITKDNETIGYKAHVQLFKDGLVVGGAVMPCYFTENCCKGKEGDAKHKAAMSAAQTFATSKAYRMNYSYVAILAGFQPTPAEEMMESENKAEHWCPIHNTNFFKRGKMKWYAHPVEGQKEWCSEGQAKAPEQATEPAKEPEAEQPKSQEPGTAPGDFDVAWLVESLKKVKWADSTVKSYCLSVYKTGADGKPLDKSLKLMDYVASLKRADQEAFFKEITDRLTMI